MNKAVIYVRVSSKEQEREGFSIPAQKKYLNEYAIENDIKVVRIFEESESAKIAGRTQFKQMLQFLKSNLDVKHILVEKTDRLYRNIKDYNELSIEEWEIFIHLVKENEILSKQSRSHQKFIHGIKVLMAKNYSDNLSEEVRKGQTEKASQGLWPSCAPIGYLNKLDDHTIIPDPKIAPLIKKCFELASTGQFSLAKLKRRMFENGLSSARSKKELGKQAISRLLTNPIYHGDFVWKGKTYKGKHQPIIERTLFDKTQEAMGFVIKPKLTKHSFAFTSLMTCHHCGCAITAQEKRKKSGLIYVYYHCTNGKNSCGNIVYLREEKIELAFAEALGKIQLPPEVVEWTKQALLEGQQEEKHFRETQIATFMSKYQNLQTKIERSYEDKLDGKITAEFWESKTAQWKQEQSDIESRLVALRQANTSYLEQGIKLMELARRAPELFKSMNHDEKRELLNLVLSNPRIENGSVCYNYKKPFSMFVNVTQLENWRGGRDSNPRPST
ncbi:MAG: recombinase family protein [Pseudobdellovibrionaceae bacterium]